MRHRWLPPKSMPSIDRLLPPLWSTVAKEKSAELFWCLTTILFPSLTHLHSTSLLATIQLTIFMQPCNHYYHYIIIFINDNTRMHEHWWRELCSLLLARLNWMSDTGSRVSWMRTKQWFRVVKIQNWRHWQLSEAEDMDCLLHLLHLKLRDCLHYLCLFLLH